MSQAFLIAKLIHCYIWVELFSQKCYTENANWNWWRNNTTSMSVLIS